MSEGYGGLPTTRPTTPKPFRRVADLLQPGQTPGNTPPNDRQVHVTKGGPKPTTRPTAPPTARPATTTPYDLTDRINPDPRRGSPPVVNPAASLPDYSTAWRQPPPPPPPANGANPNIFTNSEHTYQNPATGPSRLADTVFGDRAAGPPAPPPPAPTPNPNNFSGSPGTYQNPDTVPSTLGGTTLPVTPAPSGAPPGQQLNQPAAPYQGHRDPVTLNQPPPPPVSRHTVADQLGYTPAVGESFVNPNSRGYERYAASQDFNRDNDVQGFFNELAQSGNTPSSDRELTQLFEQRFGPGSAKHLSSSYSPAARHYDNYYNQNMATDAEREAYNADAPRGYMNADWPAAGNPASPSGGGPQTGVSGPHPSHFPSSGGTNQPGGGGGPGFTQGPGSTVGQQDRPAGSNRDTYVQLPSSDINAWPDDRFTPLTTPELQYQSPQYHLPNADIGDLPVLTDPRQQRAQQETFDYQGADPLTQAMFQSRDNSQLPDLQQFLNQAGTGQGSREDVERATFDRMFNMVEPQFRQQREQLTQNLVNRGIPIGSQAYNDAMNRMEQEQNRSRENFALTATREGGAEQSRLYDLLSRGRGQMFGETTQERAEQLAGRQQYFNEGQQRFGNLANMFGMERQARQDTFNEGSILADEASRRRAQMYGEGQGQWNREMQNIDAQRGIEQQSFGNQRQLFQEAMQRRQQGIGEYLTSRNQPISELQALMGMQRPTQQPQFPGQTQYGVQAPNLEGLVGQQYGQQANAYNQQQGNTWGGLTSLASLFM